MSTITITDDVNVNHVAHLLGTGVVARGATLTADVSEQELREAVEASDPAWVDPDAPDPRPVPSADERLDTLLDALADAQSLAQVRDAAAQSRRPDRQ